jgi:hypothetical protein
MPSPWDLRLVGVRRVRNVRVWREIEDGGRRSDWQAGCRKSCRNSWLRTGESMMLEVKG